MVRKQIPTLRSAINAGQPDNTTRLIDAADTRSGDIDSIDSLVSEPAFIDPARLPVGVSLPVTVDSAFVQSWIDAEFTAGTIHTPGDVIYTWDGPFLVVETGDPVRMSNEVHPFYRIDKQSIEDYAEAIWQANANTGQNWLGIPAFDQTSGTDLHNAQYVVESLCDLSIVTSDDRKWIDRGRQLIDIWYTAGTIYRNSYTYTAGAFQFSGLSGWDSDNLSESQFNRAVARFAATLLTTNNLTIDNLDRNWAQGILLDQIYANHWVKWMMQNGLQYVAINDTFIPEALSKANVWDDKVTLQMTMGAYIELGMSALPFRSRHGNSEWRSWVDTFFSPAHIQIYDGVPIGSVNPQVGSLLWNFGGVNQNPLVETTTGVVDTAHGEREPFATSNLAFDGLGNIDPIWCERLALTLTHNIWNRKGNDVIDATLATEDHSTAISFFNYIDGEDEEFAPLDAGFIHPCTLDTKRMAGFVCFGWNRLSYFSPLVNYICHKELINYVRFGQDTGYFQCAAAPGNPTPTYQRHSSGYATFSLASAALRAEDLLEKDTMGHMGDHLDIRAARLYGGSSSIQTPASHAEGSPKLPWFSWRSSELQVSTIRDFTRTQEFRTQTNEIASATVTMEIREGQRFRVQGGSSGVRSIFPILETNGGIKCFMNSGLPAEGESCGVWPEDYATGENMHDTGSSFYINSNLRPLTSYRMECDLIIQDNGTNWWTDITIPKFSVFRILDTVGFGNTTAFFVSIEVDAPNGVWFVQTNGAQGIVANNLNASPRTVEPGLFRFRVEYFGDFASPGSGWSKIYLDEKLIHSIGGQTMTDRSPNGAGILEFGIRETNFPTGSPVAPGIEIIYDNIEVTRL